MGNWGHQNHTVQARGFVPGQMLAVFAAVFLIFQPIFGHLGTRMGSNGPLLCAQVAAKTLAFKNAGSPAKPAPASDLQPCGHCLACPEGQVVFAILAIALFILGPIAMSGPARRRPRPFRWQPPYPIPLQARAPPQF
jgi:MFS family permease